MTLGIPVVPTHQAPISVQQLPPLGPHRKTLERNIRNNHHNQHPPIPNGIGIESSKMMIDGKSSRHDLDVLINNYYFSSFRRLRIGNSSGQNGFNPPTATAWFKQLNQQQSSNREKSWSSSALAHAKSIVEAKAGLREVNGESQQR